MGILVISPTHYEGLMWVILYFVLLGSLPIIYNLFNTHHKYVATIPMQHSLLQTSFFILFMMSMYCVASMLPCGRYYYEPEGGYVGNP
jgi:ABC-type lipoprotein release transport system permease subunit